MTEPSTVTVHTKLSDAATFSAEEVRAFLFPDPNTRGGEQRPAGRQAGTPWPGIGLLNEANVDALIRLDDTAATPSAVGAAAHALIGALVPVVDALDPTAVVETCLALARRCCVPGRIRIANSVRVAGYAIEYLNGPCRPRAPWRCLGVEFPTGDGRVDVAWKHEVNGHVFYDEIKTTRTARRSPDAAWVQQCARYAVAGAQQHGHDFLGVRLLPLGSLGASRFVKPDASVLLWDAARLPTEEASHHHG